LGAPHLPAYFADLEIDNYQVLIVRDHGSRRRKHMYISLPPLLSGLSGRTSAKSGTFRTKQQSKEKGKYYEPDWIFWNST
jgi:hypothetical protein